MSHYHLNSVEIKIKSYDKGITQTKTVLESLNEAYPETLRKINFIGNHEGTWVIEMEGTENDLHTVVAETVAQLDNTFPYAIWLKVNDNITDYSDNQKTPDQSDKDWITSIIKES